MASPLLQDDPQAAWGSHAAAAQLREAGIRLTPQRQAILEFLRSTNGHPTAEEVYENVRRAFPGISLGTVYNTLNLFAERRLIRALFHPDKTSRFDGSVDRHFHIVCERCGAIHDHTPGDTSWLASLAKDAAAASGFHIVRHEVEFFGLCPACQLRASAGVPGTPAAPDGSPG